MLAVCDVLHPSSSSLSLPFLPTPFPFFPLPPPSSPHMPSLFSPFPPYFLLFSFPLLPPPSSPLPPSSSCPCIMYLSIYLSPSVPLHLPFFPLITLILHIVPSFLPFSFPPHPHTRSLIPLFRCISFLATCVASILWLFLGHGRDSTVVSSEELLGHVRCILRLQVDHGPASSPVLAPV